MAPPDFCAVIAVVWRMMFSISWSDMRSICKRVRISSALARREASSAWAEMGRDSVRAKKSAIRFTGLHLVIDRYLRLVAG